MRLTKNDVTILQKKGVWNNDCPVHFSRLRVLSPAFIDFKGNTRTGTIMVLDEAADAVSAIFDELLSLSFPLHSLKTIDHFLGSDIASMNANNSSAFNGRKIMHTQRWSSHAFGVAIDINPRQNPYLQFNRDQHSIQCFPEDSLDYVNRHCPKPGMVEEVVPIFEKYGFTEWGGRWESKPDYHHFQWPWDKINASFPELI